LQHINIIKDKVNFTNQPTIRKQHRDAIQMYKPRYAKAMRPSQGDEEQTVKLNADIEGLKINVTMLKKPDFRKAEFGDVKKSSYQKRFPQKLSLYTDKTLQSTCDRRNNESCKISH
jgi:hypothetical protein